MPFLEDPLQERKTFKNLEFILSVWGRYGRLSDGRRAIDPPAASTLTTDVR